MRRTADGLPRWSSEGVAILALAYYAGLASDGKVSYGVRLVSKLDDLREGTDAHWVVIYPDGKPFVRVDFTTGSKTLVARKKARTKEKSKEAGFEVRIEDFAPAAFATLGASPCFPRSYRALTAGAKRAKRRWGRWKGDILSTTAPCPEHGNRCLFCEDLLALGRWLHYQLPRWAKIPRNRREGKLRGRKSSAFG